MIATDFVFCVPETLNELTDACSDLGGEGFLYYGGGSEIISMARVGSIAPKALIDLKRIREFTDIRAERGMYSLGAAATLKSIAVDNSFPLLSETVSRIADHTNQCKITLGGNVCGTIAYREAVLPLLLADANVVTFKNGKTRSRPVMQAFDKRLNRENDEAVLRFEMDLSFAHMPWVHAKRTRGDKIDYPVVTIAAIKTPDGARFALSGVTAYPFRDIALEQVFSDEKRSSSERADEIMNMLPEKPISDVLASADWRAYQTRNALIYAMDRLEGRL